jgi:two-component system cell cycle sensor histidine kinase/response regulator CckA
VSEPTNIYRDVFERVSQGVVVVELSDSDDPLSMRVLSANPAALSMLERELGGARDFDELPPELEARVRALAVAARVGQTDSLQELTSGAGKVLELRASLLIERHLLLLIDDVTALRRAEAGQGRLTQFLDSIIEHMPAMVFVKDAEALRFERFNRAGEELLGLSRDAMIGKTDYDLFPQDQADFFVAKDRNVLAGRKLEDIAEEPIETPRGTRYLHTRKIPLLGPTGEPEHLLGISLDITERKHAELILQSAHDELEREVGRRAELLRREMDERERAEQALKHAEEQLRHAQKMEAVGRLAGGVAHDFNNLLSVVISSCDLVLLRMTPGDRSRAEIEEIRKAGQRAAALTRQLLAFSRQQVLQPRVLNLNDVVHGMERMLSRVLGEDIVLELDIAQDLARVKADPSQIEQVIMNLAVNARDAMPTGGQLRIETRNIAEVPASLAPPSPGAHVRVAVSDTGIGMDDETIARIFEPFFTTKERGKGTGLGLSTVFGIVKQSGGSIAVRSAIGRGASFDVYLPTTLEVDAPFAIRPHEIEEALKGDETLLLVEDDEQVRSLCAKVLRQFGYDVIEAARPSEAIAAAASHPGAIELLLTDVVMPEMGGRLLAEHLASERPRMRVLFMSGYTDDATVRHGVLESAVAFIQKPFTPDALARSVRRALAEAPNTRIGSQPTKV